MDNLKSLIYIVDDDVSICRALTLLLKSHGFKVETFTHARSFLAYKHPKLPSCLVLDISLPDINGLTLQETMTRRGIAIPIIFITGYAEDGMHFNAGKLGEVIQKPFNLDHLMITMREYL